MKHPYFTFLSPDNFYATTEDIDPQLLSESLKSYRSFAREEHELTGESGLGRPTGCSPNLEDPTGLVETREQRKRASRARRDRIIKRFRIKSPLPTARGYGGDGGGGVQYHSRSSRSRDGVRVVTTTTSTTSTSFDPLKCVKDDDDRCF